jgi:hypothetical protein
MHSSIGPFSFPTPFSFQMGFPSKTDSPSCEYSRFDFDSDEDFNAFFNCKWCGLAFPPNSLRKASSVMNHGAWCLGFLLKIPKSGQQPFHDLNFPLRRVLGPHSSIVHSLFHLLLALHRCTISEHCCLGIVSHAQNTLGLVTSYHVVLSSQKKVGKPIIS